MDPSYATATSHEFTNPLHYPPLLPTDPPTDPALYSKVSQPVTPQLKVSNIIKMKIIPPFSREQLRDPIKLDAAVGQCIKEIQMAFAPESRSKLTIAKTMANYGERRMQTLLVIAPEEAQEDFTRLQLGGLSILGKTIFPTGEHFWKFEPSAFPKRVRMAISDLPFLCDEATFYDLLDLPSDVHIEGNIKRQTAHTEAGVFYTGRADVRLKIENAEAEQALREWSWLKMTNKDIEWMDIPITVQVPSLHECKWCHTKGVAAVGHDEMWCRDKQRWVLRELRLKEKETDIDDALNKQAAKKTELSDGQQRSEEQSSDGQNDEQLSKEATNTEEGWQTYSVKGKRKRDANQTPTNSPLATPSKNNRCSAAYDITSNNKGYEIDCHISNLSHLTNTANEKTIDNNALHSTNPTPPTS